MTLLSTLEGSAFCAGIAMGTASILSMGPNNITLIREGLTGGHVGLVATAFWASRTVMLLSALALTDKIATTGMFVRPLFSCLGVLALCWFALSSLRTYLRARRTLRLEDLRCETAFECARRTLKIFWFNPLTYVEMLIVPASISSSFLMPACRILFITGLMTMATASCYGYAFGGRACASLFKRKDMVRAFDLASCVLLSSLATIMVLGLILRPS